MKKIIKYFIPIFILFIGYKVSALETLFIGNGTVLNRCTSNVCAYPYSGTTNFRAALNNMSFNVDETYTFNLNFSATTAVASPNLTDCGLNINGAYVSPQSRNSGRTTYECNQGYTRCDSSYVSTIVWTAPNNLSDVSLFIQCDMTPQSATYTQTRFSATVSSSNGSINQTMLDVGNSIIETNNYNANQNNANRDSNSSMIGGKIDNNTNVIGGKIDSNSNSILAKLQQLIDNLTSIGSNIISGISNAITTGVNVLSAKIDDLINFQKVCDLHVFTINSSSLQNGYLNPSGVLVSSDTYKTTDYIKVSNNTNFYNSGTWPNANTTQLFCLYDSDKTLISCSQFNTYVTNDNHFSFNNFNNVSYLRFTMWNHQNNRGTLYVNVCEKSGQSIFDKIKDFFNPNVDEANSLGSSEFNNFTTTNVGLRGLLDTLVTFVQNIFSQSCSALVLPIPFVDNSVTLPCMSSIYTTYFPTFFSLYQLITTGLIAYRVIINLFHKVHQLEDVNYDKVEVLAL